jgi:hypothetical protein
MTAGRGPNAPNLFEPWALARLPSGWTGRGLFGSVRAQSAYPGEVAERLNAPVLKTGVPSRGPWVRIPPSPPAVRAVLAGIRNHGTIATRVRQLCRAKLDAAAPRLRSRAPARGMSSAPALLTIPPSPPDPDYHVAGIATPQRVRVTPSRTIDSSRLLDWSASFLPSSAARVTDARGFPVSGVQP